MDFKNFQAAVQRQFNRMKTNDLFRVTIPKEVLWDTYLNSFPEGSNPIYKERTEHDCQCCKHFIRTVGDMVAIVDGRLVSIWDVQVSDPEYQIVANAMAAMVKAYPIDDLFLHVEPNVGVEKNFQLLESGSITWNHFQLTLPSNFVIRGEHIGGKLGDYRDTYSVMLRSLTEISLDAINTVVDLINQNSIYRGTENKFAVEEFRKLKTAFNKLKTDNERSLFCWSKVKSLPQSVSRIRGTSIGTLLVDVSNDVDLDRAVASFEAKVAPTNYKRPTAVVTKKMIEQAKETVQTLGLTNALDRRYAVLEDISASNILFADRTAKKRMADVFDELAATTGTKKSKSFDKVEEVTIDQFIESILPTATSLELMVENAHIGNFVSLIAPADLTAKHMFKWDNPFSWSYNGDVADSIKERVKQAGGSVVGDLCCRLAWDYDDDLDFHMHEPGYSHIYFSNKRRLSRNGGMLDVDANGGDGIRPNPVENIYYANKRHMTEGIYTLEVNNYNRRSSGSGFEVEIDINGQIHSFVYDKVIKHGQTVEVAKIHYDKKSGEITVQGSVPSSTRSKTVWGINTMDFRKVNVVMHSPNHWDGHGVGNKHYFFMLEGCKNEGTARGFYNEFLNSELDKHRKVFEIVGSKMRTEKVDEQLSGLGFSSTLKDASVLVRVTGSFSRIVRVKF